MRAPVGVVAAMEREARVVARAAAVAGVTRAVRIVVSGVGPERAAASARALLDAGDVASVLCTGYAGALDDALVPGDLVLPEALVAPDGTVLAQDPAVVARLARALPVDLPRHAGRLATVDRPVSRKSDREALAREAAALAVDMESAVIAMLAAESGVPFAVLRCISDGTGQVLPPAVRAAVDARGEVRAAPLARSLIARPGQIPVLVALSRGVRRARRALDRALVGVLREIARDAGS